MSGATAAIIGGVASVAAAGISAAGAKSAADTQADASQNAIGLQNQEFNIANQEGAPARNLGYGADALLGQLFGIGGSSATGASGGTPGIGTPPTTSPNYSGFENNPGFQFSLGLGEQAINRQSAANGGLYAPGTATQEAQYATGFASQNYNNYVNSLLQAAGLGSTSATNTGQQAVQTGQGISNSATNIGLANASGVAGTTGSITGLLNNPAFLNGIKGIGQPSTQSGIDSFVNNNPVPSVPQGFPTNAPVGAGGTNFNIAPTGP